MILMADVVYYNEVELLIKRKSLDEFLLGSGGSSEDFGGLV